MPTLTDDEKKARQRDYAYAHFERTRKKTERTRSRHKYNKAPKPVIYPSTFKAWVWSSDGECIYTKVYKRHDKTLEKRAEIVEYLISEGRAKESDVKWLERFYKKEFHE